MSTTLFITNLSDISIFLRPKASGKGEKEWVLKIVTIDQTTQQVAIFFHVLSDVYTDLKVVEDLTNQGYSVTVSDRLSAPGTYLHYAKLASAEGQLYSFSEYVDIKDQTEKCKLIIEDITMSLTASGGISVDPVTIKIETITNPSEFVHHLWYNVSNA
ncbi:hypothetical protein [Lewinella sp. LCG006]|uniref:hypothetical protein n=1 Tax=Lewinella sp. LCG006 TaxID=3231911 RepID=UPI00345F4421